MNRRLARVVGLALAVSALGLTIDAPRKPDPEVGKSYRVPYRMTETNHFPGPRPDRRQGAVQLPGRHRGAGGLRRARGREEDRA